MSSKHLTASVIFWLFFVRPWVAPADSDEQAQLARYTSYRVAEPIRVDGKLDEIGWRLAPWSSPFVGLIDGATAPLEYATRVAIVWDEDFLYLAFTIPEAHIRADLTTRDDRIYQENDVEFFIDGGDIYYEFEINARGTVYDVLWIWRDRFESDHALHTSAWEVSGPDVFDDPPKSYLEPNRGGRLGFISWNFPGLQSAVHLEGTLNDDNDLDVGWSVEVALPWSGFGILAEDRSVPPSAGDTWRIDASRFEKRPEEQAHRGTTAGWSWNRHGQWDSHMPRTFPLIDFSAQTLPASNP